jgi:hypothetical protein
MAKEHYIKDKIYIVVILKMIILMEKFDIKVKMDKFMMDNGNKVRSMDLVFIHVLMEVIIKVNM